MNTVPDAPATPCEIGVHVLCCGECLCSCHDDAE
jgi:hypothetical protein